MCSPRHTKMVSADDAAVGEAGYAEELFGFVDAIFVVKTSSGVEHIRLNSPPVLLLSHSSL